MSNDKGVVLVNLWGSWSMLPQESCLFLWVHFISSNLSEPMCLVLVFGERFTLHCSSRGKDSGREADASHAEHWPSLSFCLDSIVLHVCLIQMPSMRGREAKQMEIFRPASLRCWTSFSVKSLLLLTPRERIVCSCIFRFIIPAEVRWLKKINKKPSELPENFFTSADSHCLFYYIYFIFLNVPLFQRRHLWTFFFLHKI